MRTRILTQAPLAVIAIAAILILLNFAWGQGTVSAAGAQQRWQDPEVWRSPPISFWVTPIQDQTVTVLSVPVGQKFLLRRINTDITSGPQPLVLEVKQSGGVILPAMQLGSDGQFEKSSHTLNGWTSRTDFGLGLGLVSGEGEELQITDHSLMNTPMGNWVFTGEWISSTLPIRTVFDPLGGSGVWSRELMISNPSGSVLAAYGVAGQSGSGVSCRFQVTDAQGAVRLELPSIFPSIDLQSERSWLLLEQAWAIEALPSGTSGSPYCWFTLVDL